MCLSATGSYKRPCCLHCVVGTPRSAAVTAYNSKLHVSDPMDVQVSAGKLLNGRSAFVCTPHRLSHAPRRLAGCPAWTAVLSGPTAQTGPGAAACTQERDAAAHLRICGLAVVPGLRSRTLCRIQRESGISDSLNTSASKIRPDFCLIHPKNSPRFPVFPASIVATPRVLRARFHI